MTLYSRKIYGEIIDENFEVARERIEGRDKIVLEKDMLNYEDIKDYMKKFNHIYGMNVKIQQADTTSRFTMK
jgi:hypothetical protein